MAKITIGNGVELDKRFYVPGLELTSECPECETKATLSVVDEYLNYAVLGRDLEVYFNCYDCDREWDLLIKLEMTLSHNEKNLKVEV